MTGLIETIARIMILTVSILANAIAILLPVVFYVFLPALLVCLAVAGALFCDSE